MQFNTAGPNMKVEEPLGGRAPEGGILPLHLVAIFPQSSPSTPEQGRSRIDTDPEEKYDIP